MTWTSLINHLLHFFLPQAFLGLGFVLFLAGAGDGLGARLFDPRMEGQAELKPFH